MGRAVSGDSPPPGHSLRHGGKQALVASDWAGVGRRLGLPGSKQELPTLPALTPTTSLPEAFHMLSWVAGINTALCQVATSRI